MQGLKLLWIFCRIDVFNLVAVSIVVHAALSHALEGVGRVGEYAACINLSIALKKL